MHEKRATTQIACTWKHLTVVPYVLQYKGRLIYTYQLRALLDVCFLSKRPISDSTGMEHHEER